MLSICMTVRQDAVLANATIKSIRETAGHDVEIICIDDGSTPPLVLDDKDVMFRRIHGRAGVGASRHIAATLATRPYILVIDSHIFFEPGWLPKALARLKDNPRTVWSCSCVCLNDGNLEMASSKKTYAGASINFFGPNRNKPEEMQFCEAIWLREHPEDGAEIPCVLGASYFFHRDFFFQIGGSRMLHSWGSSEVHLSLKAWLAGGNCRIMKDVRTGHVFRTATTYTSKRAALLFNKMLIAATIFPEPAAKFLVDRMDQHVPHKGDLSLAKSMMVAEQRHIETERAFHEVVFERQFEEYLERWNLPRFWEAGGSSLPAAP